MQAKRDKLQQSAERSAVQREQADAHKFQRHQQEEADEHEADPTHKFSE